MPTKKEEKKEKFVPVLERNPYELLEKKYGRKGAACRLKRLGIGVDFLDSDWGEPPIGAKW